MTRHRAEMDGTPTHAIAEYCARSPASSRPLPLILSVRIGSAVRSAVGPSFGVMMLDHPQRSPHACAVRPPSTGVSLAPSRPSPQTTMVSAIG